jgi:PadR family transcriptional regulator, regulatory protein AphA
MAALVQEIQLTPTSYVVLGLLDLAGEATPYELKRMADATVGHFWSLPRSQLYAEPARLARAGHLTESQEQGGRRRKLYALTARGGEALERWTSAPTQHLTELRDLAFLKLYFGADPLLMAEAQLAALRPLVEAYETMLAGADAQQAPAGPRQTLEAGIDHVRASIGAWERIARERDRASRRDG